MEVFSAQPGKEHLEIIIFENKIDNVKIPPKRIRVKRIENMEQLLVLDNNNKLYP